MLSSINIRLVRPEDADQLLAIYKPIVLETAISFETELPSEASFKRRIIDYSAKAPWIVAEANNIIIGYAYATTHRSRQAYQWSQEVTVYVHQDYRKEGIAKKLYSKLFELMQTAGFRKAIAVITLPNEASIALHKKFGFTPIGEMKNIGFKLGKWHSTSWWDKDLNFVDSIPSPIEDER